MKTDIPLKRVTRLQPADLLSLLHHTADAEVLGVETLELPSSRTSLDTVLRLRQADGTEYLHLIEWQGYPDPAVLWRTLGYLAWLGQNRPERPILVTLIYLNPGDDMGDALHQEAAGQTGWTVSIPCVRLWEQDAAAALASGKPGLVALSPLMRGANVALVEEAVRLITAQSRPPNQEELLAALGVFAEPLIETDRFIRLVTKEKLMATDLISYLMQEKTAEFEQEKTALEQEKTALEQEKTALEQRLLEQQELAYRSLQDALEEIVVTRFPEAPLVLGRVIRNITDMDSLRQLLVAVAQATDLEAVTRLLNEATGTTP